MAKAEVTQATLAIAATILPHTSYDAIEVIDIRHIVAPY